MDTIETFKPVYQRFLESGMTVRDFCKSSNLPESRSYYWQAKIRKEAIQQSGNFIPVSINNRGGNKIVVNGQIPMHRTPGAGPATLEIVYPNGVTLRITETIAPAVLRELIFMKARPMFSLNDSNRFFLYPFPTDMRKSFYSLSGIVTNEMGMDAQDGDAFIFVNRTCTSMK